MKIILSYTIILIRTKTFKTEVWVFFSKETLPIYNKNTLINLSVKPRFLFKEYTQNHFKTKLNVPSLFDSVWVLGRKLEIFLASPRSTSIFKFYRRKRKKIEHIMSYFPYLMIDWLLLNNQEKNSVINLIITLLIRKFLLYLKNEIIISYTKYRFWHVRYCDIDAYIYKYIMNHNFNDYHLEKH